MAGDWFKMLGDVAEALGVGDDMKRGMGGLGAYGAGRSTQSDGATNDEEASGVYVYERWLTRPRDPGINDR